jgi:hypothetical protein
MGHRAICIDMTKGQEGSKVGKDVCVFVTTRAEENGGDDPLARRLGACMWAMAGFYYVYEGKWNPTLYDGINQEGGTRRFYCMLISIHALWKLVLLLSHSGLVGHSADNATMELFLIKVLAEASNCVAPARIIDDNNDEKPARGESRESRVETDDDDRDRPRRVQ